MRKSKVKELKKVIEHFYPEVHKVDGRMKSLLRKFKKQYVRGTYK